jgi:hypothetical protein
VSVTNPGQLRFLSEDFGFETDSRQREFRQRLMLEGVPAWSEFKGNSESYRILGAISGFNVTTYPLYRLSRTSYYQVYGVLPSEAYIVGEAGSSRSGTNGGLTVSGTEGQFTSATALFKEGDIGSQIYIPPAGNSSGSNNNSLFTIIAVISSTTVLLDPQDLVDTGAVTDYGVGGTLSAPALRWSIVRLYTTQAPSRPRFDDVNTEAMQFIVGAPPTTPNFRMDAFCWEADFVDSYPVQITAVSPASGTGFPTVFTITVNPPPLVDYPVPGNTPDLSPVASVGQWKITDHNNNVFYLESVPVFVSGNTYTTTVYGTQVPAVDTGTQKARVEYDCPTQLFCGFCKSNRVLCVVEEASIAQETGLTRERAFERLLQRLEVEAKPAHVVLIPVLRASIEARLYLSASVTPI